MTCKDCLHHDVCYIIEHYGADETENGQEYDCRQFKDRTKWVEQKHGRWLGTHDGWYYSYSCSECGAEALTKEETMHDQVCSAYCPNCGADMREPKEASDG